jgi:hypothetical protein
MDGTGVQTLHQKCGGALIWARLRSSYLAHLRQRIGYCVGFADRLEGADSLRVAPSTLQYAAGHDSIKMTLPDVRPQTKRGTEAVCAAAGRG